MDSLKSRKRRLIFIGIIVIALGVTLTNVLKDSLKYIGILFIAIGALFFILGVRKSN